MKDKFTLLLNAIENEIFDQALTLQLAHIDGEQPNNSYYLGYRAALLSLLGKARNIERDSRRDRYLPVIYAASVTEFDRFVRAYEEFAISGKIKKR